MKSYFLLAFMTCVVNCFSQSYNEDKTVFSNFIKRMYTASAFEGVRIIDSYEEQYLISVVSLEKKQYPNESVANRVAQVKAQSQANTFLNGATISMDMVVSTTETKFSEDRQDTIVRVVESIKQNSIGFTKGLELLVTFDNEKERTVFVFAKKMKADEVLKN